MIYAASITIPTRNRKDWLRKAISSAFAQTVPVEVIVMDDGSTDGTDEMMRLEFPHVQYCRFSDGPHGPCFLRNRGAELATAPILFPIDDDAEFISPTTVEQTLKEFDHPRVAVVAIPFVNVKLGDTVLQRAPDGQQIYVSHAYYGAAHALRRDLFLAAGGYREEFFYMGEEGELSTRLLNSGYVVRVGRADLMHHHESPKRVVERVVKYSRQNDVLYVFYNVPMPQAIVHLAGTTFNCVRAAISKRSLRVAVWHLHGLLRGYAIGLVSVGARRRPIQRPIYRLFRSLKYREFIPLIEIEQMLRAVDDEAFNRSGRLKKSL